MIQTLKNTAAGQLLSRWYMLAKLKRRQNRRLTHEEFQNLRRQFGENTSARSIYFHDHFDCRPRIDSDLVRIIKKLRDDFHLRNFVETGTYDGDTSSVMSAVFDRVLTCDVKDWPRGAEFYFAENLLYETKNSTDFLREHLPEMRTQSMFYLDAHWGAYWPLRDELKIVFGGCENPVIVIDDFDAGHGLFFDQYRERKLDFNYLAGSIPGDYKFCMNPWSHRNRGMIFIFPGTANYGCRFAERDRYDEKTHGLWGKLKS
jgi:hypothetical protein